ncbi:MAG: hypothetical protein COB93_11035 [Sneathiella sp.]|nr:MAG: hypothetical protein COB93_11035 [Sneathiella sp.]
MQCKTYIKCLLIFGAILLAACQPLQRPFQPEVKNGWHAAPGPRTALYVEPVKDGPDNLDDAVATKLQELGIAAFAGKAVPNRYYVRGKVIEKEGMPYISWAIFDPQNRDTGLFTEEKLPLPATEINPAGPDLERVVLNSASNIDRLLGGDGFNFAKIKKPVIFVPIVRGAPGDGSESLAFAIQEELVRMGLEVLPTESGANYIVRGAAELSEAKAGIQTIMLTWSLERRNGEQVGKIQQRNRIKAGSLNGAWGQTAFLAAKGGAQGVYKLLQSTEAEYFKSKS